MMAVQKKKHQIEQLAWLLSAHWVQKRLAYAKSGSLDGTERKMNVQRTDNLNARNSLALFSIHGWGILHFLTSYKDEEHWQQKSRIFLSEINKAMAYDKSSDQITMWINQELAAKAARISADHPTCLQLDQTAMWLPGSEAYLLMHGWSGGLLSDWYLNVRQWKNNR